MESIKREIEILNFELFQCQDIETGKTKIGKEKQAQELREKRIQAQIKIDKYH